MKLPLPAPVPPSGLLAASLTESLSTRFRPSVPLPEPVETLTVRVASDPVTPLIDAPLMPLPGSVKSPASTPVTGSLKVTVKSTLPALVGSVLARLIDCTAGATLSIVKVAATELVFAALSVAFARTV